MVGTTLQHYRIVRAIGRGGMGEVYAAEDARLNRLVALKVLPPELSADSQRLERFQREARALAALNHPGIVTIYGVEQDGGVHFLAMELVQGQTLAEALPSDGFPVPKLLSIAIALADAIGAAHQQGVVHRDLKPANVMIAADGRIKVLDFGLAKHERTREASAETATTRGLTAQYQIVGTAAYMSPEQAQGQPTDSRSDIFSLGIILYELATGARPFRGDSAMSVISAILKDVPEPASGLKPSLPGDLDRILRRCLAKDASRRYQTAVDLRNDLEELQTAEAASSTVRRARKRRFNRALIGSAIGVLVVGAAIVAAVAWRARLALEKGAVPQTSFTQLTSMPGVEWFPSFSPDGKWIVYAATPGAYRHIFLQSVTGQNPLDISRDSTWDEDQPVFSPDGERIAFRSSREGGGIFVMGRTGEAVRRVTREGFHPTWSPDGTQLAYTTENVDVYPQNSAGQSQLWIAKVDSGQLRRIDVDDAVLASWSPHNQRIAYMRRLRTRAAGAPTNGDIWTVAVDGGPPTPVTKDAFWDWNPAWSPDGRFLYFASDRGGSMNLWRTAIDEATGKPTGEPQPITTPAPYVAHPTISADGTRIAFTSALITANIQRLPLDASGEPVPGKESWVTSGTRRWSTPDPSPDGQWVAFYTLALPEGDLYVARPDGSELRQVTGGPAIDRMPRWSPDGKWIAFFSTRSGNLELWKIRPDGSELQQLTKGGGSYMTWSPDGTRMATVTGLQEGPGRWIIFDPNRPFDAQSPTAIPGMSLGRVSVNSWAPDGEQVVGQIEAGKRGLAVYSLRTRSYERLTDFGEWPVWFPDSRRVLFVAHGNGFYVLDTKTRQFRRIYSSTRDVIGPPRMTRDGRTLFFSRRVTESDIWLVQLQ